MIEQVKAILAGWDNVRVEDNGAYWLVAGSYKGQSHAGTRADPISLAHDLAGLVSEPEPEPVAVEPEPEPIPEPEPAPAPVDAYQEHWDAVTVGKLGDAVPFVDARDAEIEALRARVAELEAELAPAPIADGEPPAEVLAEAFPDEDYTALKQRLLIELGSLRNMLVGNIPMSDEEQAQKLARLAVLEHPKFQTWLQG
jgi:hypothetical protein